MKNILLAILSSVVLVGISASSASAFEGRIVISGDSVVCQGSSVWRESRYKVIGRCDGLVYPYETQYAYYSLWAHDISRDSYVRISDIDKGFFEGSINTAFDRVIVTAETDGGPRRPSDKQVAEGAVEKFSFDKSQVNVPESIAQKAEKTGDGTMTVQSGAAKVEASTGSVGSVVGRIISSLLIILLVVVAVVVVASLLFRKRGSVSV
jgi:hypothetical protein